MKERVRFVLEWQQRRDDGEGKVNMSELCRVFGISRQLGYQVIERYLASGGNLRALAERSRRPLTSPAAVSVEVQDLIVAARKRYPNWGPKKLRRMIEQRYPNIELPSLSCMGEILRRRGMTRPRRVRRRQPIAGVQHPFAACEEPNAVWCIDFKGKFRTTDGRWCHVLTLLDAYSRFLLRCEAVLDPDSRSVERICDSAFQEFGLPAAIRSDNGPPFASTGAGGLTTLSVWWLRLGIRLERICPGEPQQNGRQERIHRTLEEVVGNPARNLQTQQRALDLFRREYNEERPHEALGLATPHSVYRRSARHYPRPLHRQPLRYDTWSAQVGRTGAIVWRQRRFFVSTALAHQTVDLLPIDDRDQRWQVSFGAIVLGSIDLNRPSRGLIITRRKRSPGEVSTMSLVNDETSP